MVALYGHEVIRDPKYNIPRNTTLLHSRMPISGRAYNSWHHICTDGGSQKYEVQGFPDTFPLGVPRLHEHLHVSDYT